MKWNFLYEITAASRTPDQGAAAPRSLSSTEFVVSPRPLEQNSSVSHWFITSEQVKITRKEHRTAAWGLWFLES